MYTINKKICAVLMVVVAFTAAGANADFSENFDSYLSGSQMHGQGGWKGWDNNPAAGALVSSAQAFSGSNSVDINGASDLVHEFSGMTSGTWTITAKQYIPTSSNAGLSYFILLNQYNDGGPYAWSLQYFFDLALGDAGTVEYGTTQSIVRDQWVELKVEVDLDANIATAYYNGLPLGSGAWYNAGGLKAIGAIDLYGNGTGAVYYDDISIVPEPATMSLLGLGALAFLKRRRRRK